MVGIVPLFTQWKGRVASRGGRTRLTPRSLINIAFCEFFEKLLGIFWLELVCLCVGTLVKSVVFSPYNFEDWNVIKTAKDYVLRPPPSHTYWIQIFSKTHRSTMSHLLWMEGSTEFWFQHGCHGPGLVVVPSTFQTFIMDNGMALKGATPISF